MNVHDKFEQYSHLVYTVIGHRAIIELERDGQKFRSTIHLVNTNYQDAPDNYGFKSGYNFKIHIQELKRLKIKSLVELRGALVFLDGDFDDDKRKFTITKAVKTPSNHGVVVTLS